MWDCVIEWEEGGGGEAGTVLNIYVLQVWNPPAGRIYIGQICVDNTGAQDKDIDTYKCRRRHSLCHVCHKGGEAESVCYHTDDSRTIFSVCRPAVRASLTYTHTEGGKCYAVTAR